MKPLLLDRVADVANYIRRANAAAAATPGGPFADDFDLSFDADLPPHLEKLQVGTSMRGWDEVSPIVVMHRSGGSMSNLPIYETVDVHFDAYASTADEALDAATFVRRCLTESVLNLPECVSAFESLGPQAVEFDRDIPRVMFEWRLTFRT